ncbi:MULTISPECIES: discoidin domain-containing protein [unclassified Streptomyces]|uniref:galactose-binding domain-containing protein n=1 Tax=unclassified Streptomyces TaxID=2593676 RepID=UPI002252D6DB|nr:MULTISPECIES: discoidin domain-containing protein [unclassified Streptomyces]MCX4398697.1 discoidin domain-containing protein [Streptomyces sp. NBC_01767]WSP50996.1 discoidin domain-containing protein [Streptomyces sp. NBC_01243]
MPRFHRLAAILAAIALAATGAAVPGHASASTAAESTDPVYTLTVGSKGGNIFASDSPSSPYIDRDGTFYSQQSAALYGPADPRYWRFNSGRDFDNAPPSAALNAANNDTTALCNNSPTGLTATSAPSTSAYSQRNYCDLIGTWVDPDTGDWIGLVHNEFTPKPFGDGMHYDAIDYATSTDQGLTWTIVGQILTSPYSTKRGDTAAFPNQTYYYGDGDQRLFVDTASGYFYVFYASSIIDKPGCNGAIHRLEHVARAPISKKMATGSWQKWYDGAWTQPGIGGDESNILDVTEANPNGYTPVDEDYKPSNPGCVSQQLAADTLPPQSPLLYMNVAYNAYLGLYVAGANPFNPNDSAHAEPFFVTDNLATQKWRKVADTGSVLYKDYWYHWFVDSGNRSSSTIVGKTFRNYCDFGCPSGSPEYRDITLDSTKPAVPPVDISKSYRIANVSGRTLTQVTGSTATTSLASPTGSGLEAWAFRPNGDGSYLITNASTGQALAVPSTATASRAWGTQPIAAAANPSDVGQQWFFLKNTDRDNNSLGSYRLVNRYSNLVLGLSAEPARLAETAPPRNWSNADPGTVGGTRTEFEQALKFTAVGIAPPFTPAPYNVALNKPTTAQSAQSSSAPALAVDSDPTNASYWGADPAPQWWQVDLQGSCTIDSIIVTNYVDGTRSYQYEVQASTDNVNWTTIATKNSTSKATSTGDTHPVNTTARYLRVNMTGNSANSGVHIADFKAIGISAP